MKFENILAATGGFGLYQKVLCFVLIPLTTGVIGLVYCCQLLVLSAPQFRCSNSAANTSLLTNESEVWTLSTDYSYVTNERLGEGPDNTWDGSCTTEAGTPNPCSTWEYDYSNIFPTLASEEDWVCDSAWRPYTVLTAFWVGNTIGACILGLLSDKFGRRPIVLICCLVYGGAGIASAFVRNYFAFLFLRIMTGSVHHTLSHLTFVLVMEFCETDRRSVPLFTIMMTYTLATLIAPVVAYWVWNWQVLVAVTAAPSFLPVLLYKWIPESASWLITQNRPLAAAKLLHTISRVNKKRISESELLEMISHLSNEKELLANEDIELEKNAAVSSSPSRDAASSNETEAEVITAVLKYPILRKQIALVMVIWMVGCMCYFGHAQNTSNLDDNMLMSFFLGALVEVPAWSAPWLIERLGRRPPLMGAYFLSGATGLIYGGLVLLDVTWPSLVVGLLGRFAITVAYYISLQYGPEVIPTVVRGQGVALAETLGGVAIFLSPLVVYLVKIYLGLPLMVFGLLGLVAGTLTFFLPETKNVALPNTLHEAEETWRKKAR
ncbi:Major facilitator superfamily [Trinorchestia longiramus]|nr:Major facilitator superfamily [Trinorchestia longiramus]